jgi:4-amino-4-deoxy-L-arabinose transferase-like glycosyltransferase
MRKSLLILIAILFLGSFLRLYQLQSVPVSLFGDEMDVGYHAFSVLKTGKDYSGNFMPLHLQSLAEWRTPLYLYSAVPTVALFGISPLGVRLPAAIFGVLGILGIYLLTKEMFKKLPSGGGEKIALLAALFLAISPWHIQYSRAGFEVTQLLFFLIFGLYFFFLSLESKGKWLWLSAICFATTPWVYSTAKFFTPFLLIFLFVVWFAQIKKFSRKYLVLGIVAFLIVGIPIAYSTVFGGGSVRFNYISVFANPTIEPEVGVARGIDAYVRGETGTGLSPQILDRLMHNKYMFWGQNISQNILQSLSFEFLFNSGDPNPRHSITGMGEFYKLQIIPFLFGLGWLFFKLTDNKIKLLFGFWILAGVIPAAITGDGGNHATRLILILPPIIILIAYGLFCGIKALPKKLQLPTWGIYLFLLLVSFLVYQHNFWVHNPLDSERWWHYGWKQAIESVKQKEAGFGKVIITTADEPPWIFFAASYEYDPAKWHAGYPFEKVAVKNFGEVSFIDKYYFGSPSPKVGIYELGSLLDADTLYLASAKESNVNLVAEPDRLPKDLVLLDSIKFPSGEPAFYLFAKK